jgi:uncharacterized protein
MEVGSSQKEVLYRLGNWLIAWRKPIAAITLGITGVMAYFAAQLDMATQFGDLLPYEHPFIAVHDKYSAQFGGANNIAIMVEVKEGTIFNPETLTKIFEMTKIVDVLPGVNHDQIDSIGHRATRYLTMQGGSIATPPVMRRPPKSERDVDEIRTIVHHTESIHGILVSLDDRAALIRANFLEGRIDYRRLFDIVNEKIIEPFEDSNTTIWVAGEPRLYGWVYHYTYEIFWVFLGTTFFMWIVLYVYFKDWRGALRPTLTGVVSAIWGLGTIHLIGFAMDPLALVIPFFVTARAVSHSVQMHDRYYEEYQRQGWNKEKAIVAAFAELFIPTTSGIITDAVGMLVILLVPVVILQRIAVSASIWVTSVMISELLLNPIVYYYLKAPDREKVLAREAGAFKEWIEAWVDFVFRRRFAVVAVWVIATALAATQLRHLTIGDPTAASPLLDSDSPYNRAHVQIQKFFGGVEPLIIVAEGKQKGALKEPSVLELMEAFQRHVEKDPDVGYSFSLADVIKSINMVFFDTQPRQGVLPVEKGRIANLFFFYFAGSPPSETVKYLDPSYTNAHVTFYCKNHQGDAVFRIIDRCRRFIAENPSEHVDLRMAGGLIGVTGAANEEILKNDILMNVLGFGSMFLILMFQYQSVVASLILHVALILANVMINAYLGYREFGINLQSLPVVTVAVGFGVDYGVYIVSRAIEEFERLGSLQESVKIAVSTSGKATTVTAVALALSTLSWTFSSIRFDSEMGLLLGLWMVISYLGAISLLPALLVILEPKFICGNRPAEPEPNTALGRASAAS